MIQVLDLGNLGLCTYYCLKRKRILIARLCLTLPFVALVQNGYVRLPRSLSNINYKLGARVGDKNSEFREFSMWRLAHGDL